MKQSLFAKTATIVALTISLGPLGSLFAQSPTSSRPQAGGPAGALVTFFPILVFVAIFYFLLFRPQQKANRERQKMLQAIKRMDKILTTGGIFGTIINIRGDILDVKISDNVKVEVHRGYIAKVITSGSPVGSPVRQTQDNNVPEKVLDSDKS